MYTGTVTKITGYETQVILNFGDRLWITDKRVTNTGSAEIWISMFVCNGIWKKLYRWNRMHLIPQLIFNGRLMMWLTFNHRLSATSFQYHRVILVKPNQAVRIFINAGTKVNAIPCLQKSNGICTPPDIEELFAFRRKLIFKGSKVWYINCNLIIT